MTLYYENEKYFNSKVKKYMVCWLLCKWFQLKNNINCRTCSHFSAFLSRAHGTGQNSQAILVVICSIIMTTAADSLTHVARHTRHMKLNVSHRKWGKVVRKETRSCVHKLISVMLRRAFLEDMRTRSYTIWQTERRTFVSFSFFGAKKSSLWIDKVESRVTRSLSATYDFAYTSRERYFSYKYKFYCVRKTRESRVGKKLKFKMKIIQ